MAPFSSSLPPTSQCFDSVPPFLSSPIAHVQIFGCYCDPYYMGYDCSLRSCRLGDDPLTTAQVPIYLSLSRPLFIPI